MSRHHTVLLAEIEDMFNQFAKLSIEYVAGAGPIIMLADEDHEIAIAPDWSDYDKLIKALKLGKKLAKKEGTLP